MSRRSAQAVEKWCKRRGITERKIPEARLDKRFCFCQLPIMRNYGSKESKKFGFKGNGRGIFDVLLGAIEAKNAMHNAGFGVVALALIVICPRRIALARVMRVVFAQKMNPSIVVMVRHHRNGEHEQSR